MYEDELLKSSPKGYAADHPQIELLKNKTFAVVHILERKQILEGDFAGLVEEVYMEMLPFRRYLKSRYICFKQGSHKYDGYYNDL